jgi:hypothetical protein
VRRLLILLVFGLVLAGVVAVTWQAMGQAKLVEEDLTAARALLGRASGFESGKLSRRLRRVDQAQGHPCLVYTTPSPRDRTSWRSPW